MNRVRACADGIPLPPWGRRLEAFARRALERLGRDGWDVSVLLCGDEEMAALNLRYRGKEGPTDVLSFAQAEGPEFPAPGGRRLGQRSRRRVVAGDIAISPGAARENALAFSVCEDEELRRLLIHGILHLDGMDHHTCGGAEPMLRLQEQILEDLADWRILPARRAPGGRGA